MINKESILYKKNFDSLDLEKVDFDELSKALLDALYTMVNEWKWVDSDLLTTEGVKLGFTDFDGLDRIVVEWLEREPDNEARLVGGCSFLSGFWLSNTVSSDEVIKKILRIFKEIPIESSAYPESIECLMVAFLHWRVFPPNIRLEILNTLEDAYWCIRKTSLYPDLAHKMKKTLGHLFLKSQD